MPDSRKAFDQLSERVLPTENVRAALAAVESGNADAAIVYKTDASISTRVRVAFPVPAADTPAINYPVAITWESKARAEAEQFVRQLRSPTATQVFERFRLRRWTLMWLPSEDLQALRFTLLACILSTVLILPFGLGIAWLLAKKRWFGKSLPEAIVTLPLVMPPVATGLILLKLLGRRGSLGGFFHRHFDLDFVLPGAQW